MPWRTRDTARKFFGTVEKSRQQMSEWCMCDVPEELAGDFDNSYGSEKQGKRERT